MDSLSATLSPFDDFEIICPQHNIPAIGVCGEYYCQSLSNFYCMKCIKNDSSCITKNHHELISLSELLYRFFVKQENKTIDLAEISSMIEIIKEYDQNEIAANLSEFLTNSLKSVEQIKNELCGAILSSLDKFQFQNLNKFKEIEKSFDFQPNEKKTVDRMLAVNIPELLTVNNPIAQESIIYVLYSCMKTQEDKNKLINDIKFLSNTDQAIEAISKIDNMVYLDKLVTQLNEKELGDKIDNTLKEIENVFDEKLVEIEKMLIPAKENTCYSTKHAIVKFVSNPNNLVYKSDICDTAHKSNSIDSVFSAYKSIKGESLVVWGTPQYTIVCFDLSLNKIVNTVQHAHHNTIFSCRHYFDKKIKRDLVITSSYDRAVKVWNASSKWETIVNIPNSHLGYNIYSACILCDEKESKNFIISSAPSEYTKIWDFNGKHVKDFGVSNESTYFINSYYEHKQNKHYILNANSSDVKSYDFKTGQLYHSYHGTPQTWHMSALVVEVNAIMQLIESDGNGNIRIWNFHTAVNLKVISSSGVINLRGVCLWNENYLFSSGSDYQVKLYNLKDETFVKGFPGHTSTVCSVDKIVHPKYGECLISHGLDGKLKLWINKT